MTYEIYLNSGMANATAWHQLIEKLQALHLDFQKWHIYIQETGAEIRYYLDTPLSLPPMLELKEFCLHPAVTALPQLKPHGFRRASGNYITLKNHFYARKGENLECVEISGFRAAATNHQSIKIRTDKGDFWLLGTDAATVLAIKFEDAPHYRPHSAPKFLDIHKILPKLSDTESGALLAVDSFPYQDTTKYLTAHTIDLNKHGLILGASGSGKSKFLSLLVSRIAQDEQLSGKHKFLILDPHAALGQEIGAFSNIIDFDHRAIDLFGNNAETPLASVELLLDVFSGLLAESWNSRLERVLRHSFYLLAVLDAFNFSNLRRLLLSLDYRNELLSQASSLPASTLDFFQAEYSEIKNRNYAEAVAPIIALADEVEMIPAFHTNARRPNLAHYLANHQVTLVSLDRNKIGRRGTQVVAGLIMQQVMCLIQRQPLGYQLTMVVDEMAVVANPLLAQLLSEARKFGLNLILIGQYFGAVPAYLRTAILANASNFFLFRITKEDAVFFTSAINLKIPLDDSPERKIRALSELDNRECIARVSISGKLQPAVKATTLEYISQPSTTSNTAPRPATEPHHTTGETYIFSLETHYNLYYVLQHFPANSSRPPARSLEHQLITSLATYHDHNFNYAKEPQ